MQMNSVQNSERRDNADIIAILLLKFTLNSGQKSKFLEYFRQHYFTFIVHFDKIK
jgi:hypothetical protein